MAVRALVVMGPSGCGKTTLGRALADRLGWRLVEGDDLHPQANKAKMEAGEALTDSDRAPWLEAVAAELRQADSGIVLTCSALKRNYRAKLIAARGDLLFILPDLSPEVLHKRLEERQGHYMPASLLRSQLATLERPEPEERALLVDGTALPEAQVVAVLGQLSQF